LIAEPGNQASYAIDQYWKLLQRVDRWYLIVPISVIQRPDYSDISGQQVDYTTAMTQVNKKWYGNGNLRFP
jgi:hypothetical protein